MTHQMDSREMSASSPPMTPTTPTTPTSPMTPTTPTSVTSLGGTVGSFKRRLSTIFPAYIRRKSARKDSIFASESTTSLWPFYIEDKLPTIFGYKDSDNNDSESTFKFGWINGVYVRTVLNIWGVMLFLRIGWMTGNAGIVVSLVIILLSTLVTLCTALSMSAICTNGEVGTGGIYYMISRSLGAEAGSMIGIIFSFGNAVLVSANLVGAAETASEILGIFDIVITNSETNDHRMIGAILLVVIAIIPLIGMDWEAKAMMGLMVLLLVSLINYFVGTFIPPTTEQISQGFVGWDIKVARENLLPKWDSDDVFKVFGVFFPSVIGIFAGASMSGDLKDPNAAIPKGTFLAIITTSSVYVIIVICLGFTVYPYASGLVSDIGDYPNPSCLANHTCEYGLIPFYQTMTISAGYGPLIYVGIFAATMSSALGSYVCAPRIFQALCEDNLFPYIKFFAKGYGKINDPRRGYALTFVIALAFIAIGNLNSIAPIISNFFMASFFLVNIACFHSSFVGSPSFRPTFKYYNKWISLLTAVVCIVIMFLLDYITALVTVLIMGVIYFYMAKKGPDVNWGSSKASQTYNSALSSALKLNQLNDHVKNFRPSILLMTGNPSARIPLVEFANTLTKNKSLLLIGHVVNSSVNYKLREKVINSQYDWMSRRKIKAFYLLLESDSLSNGSKAMIQISGLGRKLRANILMLGYKSSWRDCLATDLIDYNQMILTAFEMQMSVMILRIQEGLDYADFLEANKGVDNKSFEHDKVRTKKASLPTIIEPNGDVDLESGQQPKENVFFKQDKPSRQKLELAKLQSIKSLVPNDAIEAMNQFNVKRKGTIDIWWLSDDGGLTILVPYILKINELWSECGLRILTLAKNSEEIGSTREGLIQLMNSLRIPVLDILVFSEDDIEIPENSKTRFEGFISQFVRSDSHSRPDKTSMTSEETEKHLKLRQMLAQNTTNTSFIIMTLPSHNAYTPIALYMAWLEVLTEDMPPFLLIRGNRQVISI